MPKKKKQQSRKRASRKVTVRASRKRSQRSKKPARRAARSNKLGLWSNSLPAAMAYISNWREPQYVHRSSKGCRVRHLELVTTLTGNMLFGATQFLEYALNPGDAATFPWLSNVALDFEQYTFHGLSFIFVPSVGTSVAGNVVIAPAYDPQESPLTNNGAFSLTEGELLTYEDRAFGVPYAPLACHLNVKDMFPTGPRKYVQLQGYRSDLRTSSCGSLWALGYGATADNTTFGRLFVEYDVEFFVAARDFGANESLQPGNNVEWVGTVAGSLSTGVFANLMTSAQTPSRGGDPDGFTLLSTGDVTVLSPGWYWVRAQAHVNNSASALTNLKLEAYANQVYSLLTMSRPSGGVSDDVISAEWLLYTGGASQNVGVQIRATFASGTTTIVANESSLSIARAW